MVVLTVLEKCYGSRGSSFLRSFEDSLSSFVEGLEVQVRVLGRTDENWIQVEVSGLDASVVTNYLDQKFGLAPVFFEKVQVFSGFRGKIIDSGKVGYGLYVDVGISLPKHVDVLIPLHVLRSQLANGKKLSITNMVDAFSLYDNFPLKIQVTRIDSAKKEVEGRLSKSQSSVFKEWISLDFERVIILGATFEQVNRVIKKSKVKRDIIKIIQLGFLEQFLICKLGTEGPGIIKKIGPMLPKTPIHCLSPKRIRAILEN